MGFSDEEKSGSQNSPADIVILDQHIDLKEEVWLQLNYLQICIDILIDTLKSSFAHSF
jgi:hypothetical protein